MIAGADFAAVVEGNRRLVSVILRATDDCTVVVGLVVGARQHGLWRAVDGHVGAEADAEDI